MTETIFFSLLHRRLAQIAIGSSAIRNQGDSGLIKILREYLEKTIDLDEFIISLNDEQLYKKFLDKHTDAILSLFSSKGKSWGATRKGLNLFLREIVYNKFFAERFSLPINFRELNVFLKFMEVPLDRDVANGLINNSNGELPKWESIKNLTKPISDKFQLQAFKIAQHENIARVNLDLEYWRKA